MMDYKKMKKSEVVEAASVFEGALRRSEAEAEALRKQVKEKTQAIEYLREAAERSDRVAREKGAKVQLGKSILTVMKDNHIALTLFGYTFIFMTIPKSLAVAAKAFRVMDSLDECPRFRINSATGEAEEG